MNYRYVKGEVGTKHTETLKIKIILSLTLRLQNSTVNKFKHEMRWKKVVGLISVTEPINLSHSRVSMYFHDFFKRHRIRMNLRITTSWTRITKIFLFLFSRSEWRHGCKRIFNCFFSLSIKRVFTIFINDSLFLWCNYCYFVYLTNCSIGPITPKFSFIGFLLLFKQIINNQSNFIQFISLWIPYFVSSFFGMVCGKPKKK